MNVRIVSVTLALAWIMAGTNLAVAGSGSMSHERQFRDFVRDAWSLEVGLPQRSVTAIAQGPQGYLWVGTQHGLARFDGIRFRTYTTQAEPALTSNEIGTLYQDSSERLWVGSSRGLTRYDDQGFQAIAGPTDEEGRAVDIAVNAIAETKEGRIVAGGPDGLFLVQDDKLMPVGESPGDAITALYDDGRSLWVGGVGRYWRFENLEPVEEFGLPADGAAGRVSDFAQHDGELWVATNAGLYRGGEHRPRMFQAMPPIPESPIHGLLTDSAGTLWVGMDAALLRIHDGRLAEVIDNTYPAAHPQTRSLHEDHEGNLWLGSSVDGLARYWSGWVDRYSADAGIHHALTWSVADAGNGALWVGTSDGLSLLADGQFELHVAGQDLPHPHAYTLLPDDDELWIGTRSGLVVKQLDSGNLATPAVLAPLDALQINGIVPAGPHGRYFFATLQGLFLWDGEDGLDKLERLGNRAIRQVRLTGNDTLVVVTDSGVFVGPPDRLEPPADQPEMLASGNFTTATRLDDSGLIFSTLDHGLVVGHGDRFRMLTMDEGLSSDSSYYVVDDGMGHIWVSGFEGLFRIARDELERFIAGRGERVHGEMLISESGRHPGSQQGYCCNGAGHAKGLLREDGLWLPTRDGVVRIRPDRLVRNPVPPRVLIKRYRASGDWHALNRRDTVELPRGERDLAIEFTALSFRDPSSVHFRYRLKGFDEEWQKLEGDLPRSVSYTNLPPGSYHFELHASNNAGLWAEQPATMGFEVPPYFHETAWFRSLLIASTLLLLIAGYRWRRHQWHLQQAALKRQVAARTEELRQTNARLVEANRNLKDLSTIDTLTGLRNRRHLYERMSQEPARLARLRDRSPADDLVIGFALVDVDYFKQVNDEHGHHAGDQVLEQIGLRLNEVARQGDHVVRWGGEEFLVVLAGLPRAESATVLGRMSRTLSETPYRLDRKAALSVTCSIGYAELPSRPTDPVGAIGWESLVELADQALYLVKQTGRNGWAILRAGPDCNPASVVKSGRDNIARAIERGELELITHTGHQGS
jgi:diguanylate cyclase (GGDEF)-like protein